MKDLPAESKQTGNLVIRDPDTGEEIIYTEIERLFSKGMLAFSDITQLYRAITIGHFCGPKKYYRLEGYATEREFIEQRMGMGYAQGRKYKQIGLEYWKMFPLQLKTPENEKCQPLALLKQGKNFLDIFQNQEGFRRMSDFLNKIGVEKFYRLISYNFTIDYDNDKLYTADGEAIDIEDVLTSRILDKETKGEKERKKLRKENQRLREKVKSAEAERDSYAEKLKRLDEIDKLYGPGAERIEAKRNYLKDIQKEVDFLDGVIGKINVQPKDPISLQRDLADLIKRMSKMHSRAADIYDFVMEAIE